MDTQNTLTCNVTSDLMILYTTGKTSPETNALIENHLHTCEACAQAFAREPHVRERIEQPKAYKPTDFDDFLEKLKYFLLPVWGFILYVFSRTLTLLDKVLRRFGKSTTSLKIRVYRARRNVAGMQQHQNSAPAAATAGK
jgi:hypothetical protein